MCIPFGEVESPQGIHLDGRVLQSRAAVWPQLDACCKVASFGSGSSSLPGAGLNVVFTDDPPRDELPRCRGMRGSAVVRRVARTGASATIQPEVRCTAESRESLMPTSRVENHRQTPGSRGAHILGFAVLLALLSTSLILVIRHGGYAPADWLLPMIVLGAVGLSLAALAVFGLWPRAGGAGFGTIGEDPRLSPSQRMLLLLLGLLAAWTAASLLWAGSRSDAWEETNRTLFYLVAVALVVVFVRLMGRRSWIWLIVGLIAVITVAAFLVLLRLGWASDPTLYFASGRLNYPITYWNGLAAFLVMGFWLALGAANVGGRLVWAQALLLALATLFLELALLPQSRAALWSLALVLPFFVVLSPHRFRALTNLAVVSFPVVLLWPALNRVYVATRDARLPEVAIASAMRAMTVSVIIVMVLYALTRGVEWLILRPRRKPGQTVGESADTLGDENGRPPVLGRRPTILIAVVLAAIICIALTVGLLLLEQKPGGLSGSVNRAWTQFSSDKGIGKTNSTRFVQAGLNQRAAIWKVALAAFRTNPLHGIGAQNFENYFYQHRSNTLRVAQPHSQPLQLLAELGIPGALLWLVFAIWGLTGGAISRFRTQRRTDQALMAAVITAALGWFIHSSVDWLWQLTAVSLPAMLLFGVAVAVGSSRTAQSDEGRRDASRMKRAAAVALAIGALLVLLSALFPYLSVRATNAAATTAVTDPTSAVSITSTAAWQNPLSPEPLVIRAQAYTAAAKTAAGVAQDRARMLGLAAGAWEEAERRDPRSWPIVYESALALLRYRDAVQKYTLTLPPAWLGPGNQLGGLSVDQMTTLAGGYVDRLKILDPLGKEAAKIEAGLPLRPAGN